MTSYLRQRQFPSEESANPVIDNTVLDALEKQPFSSIRELAKLTCFPTTTIYRHLTRSLGFVVKHFR
jgi:DNA-binding MurR/RpiR family transcriptional regulator